MAFDILAMNKTDARKEPLLARKQLMQIVLGKKKGGIAFVDFVEQEGEVLFGVTTPFELEGVMAKRSDSIYKAGRPRDWLKFRTAVGKEREAKRFDDC